MHNLLRIQLLALTALLTVMVFGRQVLAETTELKQYDVEVIVFRNLSGQSDGEQWPWRDTERPGGSSRFPLEKMLDELPASDYRMQRIATALNRSGAYRVMAHKAWRQPARKRADSVPYEFAPAAGDGLTGAIMLMRERFLHLDIDLALARSDGSNADVPVYTLQEKRRVRSGELHYFDHPRFGVIAEVTPWEAPEPVVTEPLPLPADTEAAGAPVPADPPSVEMPIPVPDHEARPGSF
ncbi:MAG: CsiV family protein [Pseudomonadota bacterium]